MQSRPNACMKSRLMAFAPVALLAGVTVSTTGRLVTVNFHVFAAGNKGPGPDLTHVGSTLSQRQIERAILNPTAPMPSFRNLPKAKLHALVAFLSELR